MFDHYHTCFTEILFLCVTKHLVEWLTEKTPITSPDLGLHSLHVQFCQKWSCDYDGLSKSINIFDCQKKKGI